MKHSRLIVLGATCAAIVSSVSGALAGSAAAAKPGVRVSVRVEGIESTLLPGTSVLTRALTLDPDGKPADTCTGDTAAAALQLATHGHWTAGAYYSGLGYSIEGIFGETYPFTSAYYWSFWVDGKAATTGICGVSVHPGQRLLFFPQCSKMSAAECPQGMFNPAVLELKGPARTRAGHSLTFKVLRHDNLTGKPSPGVGVSVTAGGHTVRTGASGTARLRFAKAGRYRVSANLAGAVRDELTVTVRR